METDTRVPTIIERYGEGATLGEIGEELNVTRQRIHQLLMAAGVDVVALREHGLEQRKRRDAEEVKKLLQQGMGAKDIGGTSLSLGERRALITPEIRSVRRAVLVRQNRGVVYSDKEIFNCIKEAASGQPLSSSQYQSYITNKKLKDGRPWPSASTIVNRFGWASACAKAGVETAQPKRRGYAKMSDDDLIEAVVIVAQEIGRLPTVAEYNEVSQRIRVRHNGEEYDLPSVSTIRLRFRRWQVVLEHVLRRMDNDV